jgi:RimJ/RimL family protein N-acetyltransferase
MHILVTKRLTLRPAVALDADDIAAGLSNRKVARNLAAVPYPYFPADALDWINGPASDPDNLVYTIHREKLIGVVSLEGGGPEPQIGYWLAEEAHGHGFMTEAAGALIRHAAASRSITGVQSLAFIDNPASMRVLKKLGFTTTGLTQTYSRSRGAMVDALTARLDVTAAAGHARAAKRVAA